MVRRLFLSLAALLPALVAPATAVAAPQGAPTPPQGSAALVRPLSLIKLADMDFGYLAVSGNGTATINPNSGILTTAGGVTRIGGVTSPARMRGAGTRLGLVVIRTPASVILTRAGGTQTLVVNQFSLDGFPIRIIGAGPFDFAVGGRLNVPAGTVEGSYSGLVNITVEYF